MDIVKFTYHAEELFEKMRWPDGPTCPVCGSKHYYITSKGRYICKHCKKNYSIKTDTLFHQSHISIVYWMIALYYMVESRGISSYQLAKHIGVTPKTAYYMQMRLRIAMDQSDIVLEKEIAMDEWYVGGTWRCFSLKKRNELLDKYKLPKVVNSSRQKLAIANKVNSLYKQPVFGMNDGSNIVLKVLPNPVQPIDVVKAFNNHSKNIGEAVSDCSSLYNKWMENTGYILHNNNHSKGQFIADNGSSSNRIEGTFSLSHREFLHHHVHARRGYLQLYMNELAFRWNNRNLSTEEKINKLLEKCVKRIDMDVLRHFIAEENKLYNEGELMTPWDLLRDNCIIDRIEDGGLIYTRKEMLERFS